VKEKLSFNNLLKRERRRGFIKRYITLIVGLFIYACTFNLFLLNNDIVAGGISGIATITKSIIDPSTLIFILSIVLLIMSFIFLGKEKTMASIVGSLLFPLFVKLTVNISDIITITTKDMLLITIFAGVLSGVASGLIFKNGFTTGGTDILNQIVSKYAKRSIGSSMMMTDGLIVLVGGFFFGWTKAMYAIMVLYILSIVADRVILGISDNKAFYIMTEKTDEVKNYILENLSHGVTVLSGKGGFSGERQSVLMCVVPTKDYFRLKEDIYLIDNEAFIVATDAYEVIGGR
jgi:uncharacterized membrane-anchored protein YitT (DUF2179 family)